jgi:hypothetical protein
MHPSHRAKLRCRHNNMLFALHFDKLPADGCFFIRNKNKSQWLTA